VPEWDRVKNERPTRDNSPRPNKKFKQTKKAEGDEKQKKKQAATSIAPVSESKHAPLKSMVDDFNSACNKIDDREDGWMNTMLDDM
jgi:hypothetical protein